MGVSIERNYVEEIRELIESKNRQAILDSTQDLHPADIAEILAALTLEEAMFVYQLFDSERASDVLVEIPDDERNQLLRTLKPDVIAREYIEHMDSDDAADILGGLDEEVKNSVLKEIDDVEIAGDIVDLLEYEEDTAGGIMAKELVTVNENWTVGYCLREISRQAENVDEIYYVYVVDDKEILKGVLSLKKLLLNNTNTRISGLYNKDIKRVTAETPQEEVAWMMEKYDLVAIPVVDDIGRLKGRITFDDVIDVMREEAERDYQMVSGIVGDVEPGDKIWSLTRARFPWLLVGLLGGILGARVIGANENSLKIVPEMAFYFPLIAAMAGNVGVQSSSIVVQSIASGVRDFESTSRKLMKEMGVALIIGISFSMIIFGYNILYSGNRSLTWAVSLSLFVVILFASVFGTIIPLLLNRLKIDPALATGPFITTMNDVLGLTMYLMISKLFFNIL